MFRRISTKHVLGIVVSVLLLILLGVGSVWAADPVTNAVSVSDQEIGEGNTVTIDQVTADVAGWLVVHADSNGAPGPVIGYAAVPQGTTNNLAVSIDLSRATGRLYAMLHVDAGTVGKYEFPGADGPARDANGNVVTPLFNLSANAVVVMDQLVESDNIVRVARVLSKQQGWLVIHADANGAPGPVLGWSHVGPGENNNVNIVINPAGKTDAMFAMLHVDNGVSSTYEFPGADVPARDTAGKVVTPSFHVIRDYVKATDQYLSPDATVIVPEVVASRDGWMVIHAEREGGGIGPVIGHAAVSAGINQNVRVSVTLSGLKPTLYAMLHVDAGSVGVYEFPGPDGPVFDANGVMVSPPFELLGNGD